MNNDIKPVKFHQQFIFVTRKDVQYQIEKCDKIEASGRKLSSGELWLKNFALSILKGDEKWKNFPLTSLLRPLALLRSGQREISLRFPGKFTKNWLFGSLRHNDDCRALRMSAKQLWTTCNAVQNNARLSFWQGGGGLTAILTVVKQLKRKIYFDFNWTIDQLGCIITVWTTHIKSSQKRIHPSKMSQQISLECFPLLRK